MSHRWAQINTDERQTPDIFWDRITGYQDIRITGYQGFSFWHGFTRISKRIKTVENAESAEVKEISVSLVLSAKFALKTSFVANFAFVHKVRQADLFLS